MADNIDMADVKPGELRIGDRVQLHPATDRWMMGDRYGVVRNIIRSDDEAEKDRLVILTDRGKLLRNAHYSDLCDVL
jgi:hypothetical protein